MPFVNHYASVSALEGEACAVLRFNVYNLLVRNLADLENAVFNIFNRHRVKVFGFSGFSLYKTFSGAFGGAFSRAC